jgi:hypothetical protein
MNFLWCCVKIKGRSAVEKEVIGKICCVKSGSYEEGESCCIAIEYGIWRSLLVLCRNNRRWERKLLCRICIRDEGGRQILLTPTVLKKERRGERECVLCRI